MALSQKNTNEYHRAAQKNIWGEDNYSKEAMEKIKQAEIDNNPYLAKPANDNNYFQGGAQNVLPQKLKETANPEIRFAQSGRNNKSEVDNTDNLKVANVNDGPIKQRNNKTENIIDYTNNLKNINAQIQSQKTAQNIKQKISIVIGEFAKQDISISENDALMLLEKNLETPIPWIMLLVAIIIDILDILVLILGVVLFFMGMIFTASVILAPIALVPSGLSFAIGIFMAIISFLFSVIFFFWSKKYGNSTNLRNLSGVNWKIFKRFLKRRGWTYIIEYIPLLQSLPIKTYNVYSLYKVYSSLSMAVKKKI